MTVNRAQLLQGNSNLGVTLGGQPQAVRQGGGFNVGADGSISFDSPTSQGVILLNNPQAFNGYIWPNTQGFERQFLGAMGNNALLWSAPKGLVELGFQPDNPSLGEQWFNYQTSLLSVFQNKESQPKWQSEFRGLDPVSTNCTSAPPFTAGGGSEVSPYALEPNFSTSGKTILSSSLITITGLAPYQYVPLKDLNQEINGYRFSLTNFFSNENGELIFRVQFTDNPKSFPGDTYTLSLSAGYGGVVSLTYSVSITEDITVQNPGTIAGQPSAGFLASYQLGLATGGVPPYIYSWKWKTSSGRNTLQTGGNTYTISPLTVGDRVYVEVMATDSQSNVAYGVTSAFPPPPNYIERGDFPQTTVYFPQTLTEVSSTLWLDEQSTLRSNGCVELSNDGLTFNQGPISVDNQGTLTTRWSNSSSCGSSENGATLSGCVYSESYQECSSIVIDRVPSPFTLISIADASPGETYQSNLVSPQGFNAVSYLTRDGLSNGADIQASLDNGLSWADVPLVGGTSLPINPGQSFRVRLTTGSTLGGKYNAIINVGSGLSNQTASFTVTNSSTVTFSTAVTFPITTNQEIASPVWSALDGSTSLSATGCIEFKVGPSGSWRKQGDSPEPITTGDILYTRWSNDNPSVCGNSVHGTTITGSVTDSPSGGTKTNTGSLIIDRVPSPFDFTDISNQAISSLATSNIVNVSGINAPAYITLDSSSTLLNIEVNINGSGWVSVPTSGETLPIPPVPSGSGSSLQIRGLTGSSPNSSYNVTVKIGQSTSVASSTWVVSTIVVQPSIVTPSVESPVNGSSNLNPTTYSPPGITINSSPYTAINGAGSQVSSDWEVYYFPVVGGPPTYIVQESDDTVNLQSLFISSSSFSVSTTYYARVRYKTTSPTVLYSSWSNVSQFKTSNSFNLQFTLRTPGRFYNGAFASATSTSSGYTVFVGDPRSGSILRTLDGVSFTPYGWPETRGATQTGLAYGSGKFVSVGSSFSLTNSEFWVSTNEGVNWSRFYYSGVTDITSIAYSPTLNLFCAVGLSGTVYTSPGGTINWTAQNSGTLQNLQSVIWDGAAFRACGGTSLISSANGTSWNLVTIPRSPDGAGLFKIAYNQQASRYIMSRIADGFPYDLMAGASAYVLNSNDCINWSQSEAPSAIRNVAGGGDWFVATTYGGGSNILLSNDASNWVSTSASSYISPSLSLSLAVQYLPSVSRFVIGLSSWTMASN